MDGICVSEAPRGKGVGTALLQAIFNMAAEDRLNRVRLDVTVWNPSLTNRQETRSPTQGWVRDRSGMEWLTGYGSC
ncbi:GNAT family N-acetyltransferase [Roseibium sp.]|uniref:GNAT family N-acetyltransferase n=1 Tax=Roseibium sp. TaxID=1936156 RepID=UPI003BAC7078